jgi:hypothetical protein
MRKHAPFAASGFHVQSLIMETEKIDRIANNAAGKRRPLTL